MGYAIERFIDQPVDENFVCAVCNGVIDSAVLGCPHGHAFCASCNHTLKERGTCALCHVNIATWQPAPCLPLQNLIRILKVRCGRTDNDASSCSWTGKLENLQKHDLSCEYLVVACTHKGCQFRCARRSLAAHQAVCEFKPVRCPLCNLEMQPDELNSHLANSCLEQTVPCPMQACGCNIWPKRRDLAAHQIEQAEEHGRLAAALASRLQEAETRLNLSGGWQPDPMQALSTLSRIREQATADQAREELVRRGALQLAIGIVVSQRRLLNVQIEGFGAILAICTGAAPTVFKALTPLARMKLGAGPRPLAPNSDTSPPPPLPAPPGVGDQPIASPHPPNGSRKSNNADSPRLSNQASGRNKVQGKQTSPPLSNRGQAPRAKQLVLPELSPNGANVSNGVEQKPPSTAGGSESQGPAISGALATRLQAASDAGALEAVVGSLVAHPAEARLHVVANDLVVAVCSGSDSSGGAGRRLRAASAGAIELVIDHLNRFPSDVAVQESAAGALHVICTGDDEDAATHRARATDAGGIEALCVALSGWPAEANLQERCCQALSSICHGSDTLVRSRKTRAADAGAIAATSATCRNHPPESAAAREALRALIGLCSGLEQLSKPQQQRTLENGALRLIIGSLNDGSTGGGETARYKAARYRALRNLTRNNEKMQEAAKELGAKPEWL